MLIKNKIIKISLKKFKGFYNDNLDLKKIHWKNIVNKIVIRLNNYNNNNSN